MAEKKEEESPRPERIQGTDGIRREVRLASHKECRGLTPQQVFRERGFITEQFMELYACCHARRLLVRRSAPLEIVIGWDPRDVDGKFTGAVVRGVRKAGAVARVLGTVPTPLVPLYMLYKNCGGGFMVTASHNPKDQNGIKTFLAFRGMKLLPENDVELTRDVLAADYEEIARLPLAGARKNCRREALDLFQRFSIDPENAWTHPAGREKVTFDNVTLVVDPANGALSGIAAEVFRAMGFASVIEENGDPGANVNLHSGVADLEGHHKITRSQVFDKSSLFAGHRALKRLFEIGKKHKASILSGRRRVAGAVFDADGDRFFRLDYDPFEDALIVSSGDETAFMQARYLMAVEPERYRGALYINTVESDLNAAVAAAKLGLTPHLTPVGDKWILLKTARMIAEARQKALGSKNIPPALRQGLRQLGKKSVLDVGRFEAVEEQLDGLKGRDGEEARDLDLPFAVGSEETGHNITRARLDLPDGRAVPVFFGNGLKSALNTFSATQYLARGRTVSEQFSRLRRPFPPGFKATLYAYYIDKELFYKNSPVWKKVRQAIKSEAGEAEAKAMVFGEDPDMLYLSFADLAGGGPAAVFVRNSGTENKIGINLRGGKKAAPRLKAMGESAIRILLAEMKDPADAYGRQEKEILRQLQGGPRPEGDLEVEERVRVRLFAEMGKQGLVEKTPGGLRLTRRGRWYVNL